MLPRRQRGIWVWMNTHLASEPTSGSRGKTALAVGSGAVPAVDMRQQPMVSVRESGGAPCLTTVMTDSISQKKAEPVPRFLVIGRKEEGNFDKVNPFLISKALFGLVGNLKMIKKIKEGLLVETVSESQAMRLMKIENLGQYTVKVTGHRSLNTSKGVVTCRDFLNCTTEELLEELKSEGVIEVRRIYRRKEGKLVDTPSHILTFNRPKLPLKVKAAFYSLPVRQYIPSPLRCFNCQQLGHISQSCQNPTCCTCGRPPHDEDCEEPFKCVNCGGNHHCRYNNCPKLKEEINIQHIKTTEKLSYTEAKRKVQASSPSGISYAAATNSRENQVKDIIQNLLPNITKILEEQVKKLVSETLTRQMMHNSYPSTSASKAPEDILLSQQSNTEGGCETQSMSDASLNENRKRTRRVNYREESDSDESVFSQSNLSQDKKKKKHGWPKGKARKPPDATQLLNK